MVMDYCAMRALNYYYFETMLMLIIVLWLIKWLFAWDLGGHYYE